MVSDFDPITLGVYHWLQQYDSLQPSCHVNHRYTNQFEVGTACGRYVVSVHEELVLVSNIDYTRHGRLELADPQLLPKLLWMLLGQTDMRRL